MMVRCTVHFFRGIPPSTEQLLVIPKSAFDETEGNNILTSSTRKHVYVLVSCVNHESAVCTRGETIRVHHDTIRITIQSSRYDTYRDMLYTCTCTAEKLKNILISGSQILQLEIHLWIMHYYIYGTTNNDFFSQELL